MTLSSQSSYQRSGKGQITSYCFQFPWHVFSTSVCTKLIALQVCSISIDYLFFFVIRPFFSRPWYTFYLHHYIELRTYISVIGHTFRQWTYMVVSTDYGRPERKKPSLHGQKFTPTPKFLGTAKAYFVCHFGPIFQISLIYAFIGCP